MPLSGVKSQQAQSDRIREALERRSNRRPQFRRGSSIKREVPSTPIGDISTPGDRSSMFRLLKDKSEKFPQRRTPNSLNKKVKVRRSKANLQRAAKLKMRKDAQNKLNSKVRAFQGR